MIESKYNYYVNNHDRVICLNGISGKVFSISQVEFSFLSNLFSDEKLHSKYPSVINWLSNNKFLINNHLEELDYLRNLHMKSKDNEYYNLVINPTQECNFNCWYCYEKHTCGHMSEKIMNNIKSHLNMKLKAGAFRKFDLSWFGGEPLLYFNRVIYPLSVFAKEKCNQEGLRFSNSITTNGYLINKKMIKKFEEIGLSYFQITLDGDKSAHDKIRNQKGYPSFDRIIQNCVLLCTLLPNSTIILRVNYTNENINVQFSEILDVISPEFRKQITVQFQRVWQTYSVENKTCDVEKALDRNRTELKEAGFNVSNNHNFSIFKGSVCYADRINYAHINYDGSVYRCTARDYSPEKSLGTLTDSGEIVWKEDVLQNIDSKPFFENDLCIDCKYLPLCGGPCFQKTFEAMNDVALQCPKRLLDSSVETFIKEYFFQVKKQNNIA